MASTDGPEEGTLRDLVVPGSLLRRLGELGIALLWAIFCLMVFFPPSGQTVAPWLLGPLSALASLSFLRKSFDRRPRLVVDAEGITDRTAWIGGPLFVPWSEVLDVSTSKWGGDLHIVARDLAAVRRRAGPLRRLSMGLSRLLGMRTIPINIVLLGVEKRMLKDRLDEGLSRFERRELGLDAPAGRLEASDEDGPR